MIRGRQHWFGIQHQPLSELNEEVAHYFGEGKKTYTLLMITDQTNRRQQMELSRLEKLRSSGRKSKHYFRLSATFLMWQSSRSQTPLNMLQAALRLDDGSNSSHSVTAINTALQTGRNALERLNLYRPKMKDEEITRFNLMDLSPDLHPIYKCCDWSTSMLYCRSMSPATCPCSPCSEPDY